MKTCLVGYELIKKDCHERHDQDKGYIRIFEIAPQESTQTQTHTHKHTQIDDKHRCFSYYLIKHFLNCCSNTYH
jgi:hypothetical protein